MDVGANKCGVSGFAYSSIAQRESTYRFPIVRVSTATNFTNAVYLKGSPMNRREWILARLALVVLATATAASCAHKTTDQAAPIPQDISQGNIFALLMPIEVAKGKAAVFFQAGRVIAEEGIRADDPVCRLEPGGPARAKLTTIQPQRFRVTNITYDDRAQGRAQRSTTSIALSAGNGGVKKRIACWWPGVARGPDFVTSDDIGATLGPYFSIEVPN